MIHLITIVESNLQRLGLASDPNRTCGLVGEFDHDAKPNQIRAG